MHSDTAERQRSRHQRLTKFFNTRAYFLKSQTNNEREQISCHRRRAGQFAQGERTPVATAEYSEVVGRMERSGKPCSVNFLF